MSWAVVLGATAGTGAAVAREVARDPGLHVYGVHRGHFPDGAAEVAAAVRAAGRHVHLRVGDAGTPEGAASGAEELLAVAGPRSVKLFVHSIACASVTRLVTGPGAKPATPRQVQKTFDAMAHSFVWWAQELHARDLLAPNARLIALSNPVEMQILRGTALIAAAKASLAVYVRHLAHELGPLGHRVNLVRFGAARTRALGLTVGDDHVRRHEEVLSAVIPAGRLVTLEEVARVVGLLCTDTLGWFNGADLDLTGGENQALLDQLVFGGG